ncbi:hypothetical protein E2I00_000404 [Balaenoptera physalus]|uniref:Urotensin-2 n=1 Tax=Balaenoptera physalus TaxID=9770 RepID=A0A643BLE6_BALPH|nr:hypothetical protein E2I00_000404 [Balaenoptera physalus]
MISFPYVSLERVFKGLKCNVVAEDLEALVKQVETPEDVRSTLDELERASLLQMLPEMSGAETGDGLRKAGKMILVFTDPGTNIFYPRGSVRKAFSGQDPNISLSHLLARIRKPYKKRGTPSECFWKYCV